MSKRCALLEESASLPFSALLLSTFFGVRTYLLRNTAKSTHAWALDKVLHRDELWKHSDYLVSHAEHEISRFVEHTDATLFHACDYLRRSVAEM